MAAPVMSMTCWWTPELGGRQTPRRERTLKTQTKAEAAVGFGIKARETARGITGVAAAWDEGGLRDS